MTHAARHLLDFQYSFSFPLHSSTLACLWGPEISMRAFPSKPVYFLVTMDYRSSNHKAHSLSVFRPLLSITFFEIFPDQAFYSSYSVLQDSHIPYLLSCFIFLYKTYYLLMYYPICLFIAFIAL